MKKFSEDEKNDYDELKIKIHPNQCERKKMANLQKKMVRIDDIQKIVNKLKDDNNLKKYKENVNFNNIFTILFKKGNPYFDGDERIFEEEFKKKFKIKFKKNSDDKYRYVYIAFANGMIIVVGRTSFKDNSLYCGDLFDFGTIWRSASTTEKIVACCGLEDAKELIATIKILDKKLKEFIEGAVIIPLEWNDEKSCKEMNRELGVIEYEVGNYLKDKFPILNYYSHNW